MGEVVEIEVRRRKERARGESREDSISIFSQSSELVQIHRGE